MKELHILNLGAGVQSTALYLMLFDKLDYAIFADTGEEPEAVYKHLEWLKSLNGPPILTGSAGRIGDDLSEGKNSTGQRFASIPAFNMSEEGKVGLMRRQCTSEYKIAVVNRIIRYKILKLKYRGRIPKDIMIIQYFGISMDEIRRSLGIKRQYEGKKQWEVRFPLLDPKKNYTRREVREYLKDKVPHRTPRSSCGLCPFHSNEEWLKIKRHDPVAWARAVEIDKNIRIPGRIVNRGLKGTLYLHRSCKPLDEIDFEELCKKYQLSMFVTNECTGGCGL